MPSKRETIEPKPGDKRFIRRDEQGRFQEQDDVSRSLPQDKQRESDREVESGLGDKGERSRRNR